MDKNGAYPRSRGGTRFLRCQSTPELGLSPLARGNPGGGVFSDMEDGPIPARAGEPFWSFENEIEIWAYPRSRGGTKISHLSPAASLGLSPLARGNPIPWGFVIISPGPIPARAGEPSPNNTIKCFLRAYPRSRGGTRRSCFRACRRSGLSPLARGNHRAAADCDAFARPIPARAGEPRRPMQAMIAIRAYPRSRGGTSRRKKVC